MLSEEDYHLFTVFKVRAMGEKLREIFEDEAYDHLTCEEKVKLALDAEVDARRDRKVAKLFDAAKFKLPDACVEDVIYLSSRSLVRDRVVRYSECRWVEDNEVLVLISKSGCGKSYLAQAFGNAACRHLHTVRYTRLYDMLADLNKAREANDGSFYDKMDKYKHVKLLIVDDFMTTPIVTQGAIDLFEIMEAREGRCSTLISSQLEPNEWYLRIEGELMADSILNRIATGARYLDLKGPNMREYLADKRDAAEAAVTKSK